MKCFGICIEGSGGGVGALLFQCKTAMVSEIAGEEGKQKKKKKASGTRHW